MRSSLGVIVLMAILMGIGYGAEPATRNWGGFRGTGENRTTARDLPVEWGDDRNIAWNVPLPGYGQSSPVVWGDRIFLTAVEGGAKEKLIVLCLDLKSGRRLWSREFVSSFTQKDVSTVSKAAPTPVVDANRLYVFFESGDLIALNHKGRAIWHRRLTQEYGEFNGNHGLGSSVAMTRDALAILVAHAGPSYLLMVEKGSGRNLWKADRPPGGGWSSPLVIGRKGKEQILVSINKGISAYDAGSGQVLWSVKDLKGNNIPSPATDAAQKIVVAGSSDKGMNVAYRLEGEGDVSESQLLWRAGEATSHFASPLVHRDEVYLINKVGIAFCLDLLTGEERWRQRLGGEFWASPLAAGDRIYFFGVDGKTHVLRAGPKFDQLSVNTISEVERVYGVAAVDGALLLRSGRKLIKLSGKGSVLDQAGTAPAR